MYLFKAIYSPFLTPLIITIFFMVSLAIKYIMMIIAVIKVFIKLKNKDFIEVIIIVNITIIKHIMVIIFKITKVHNY